MFIRQTTDLRTGEVRRFDLTVTVRDGRTGRIIEQRPVPETVRRAVLIGYRVMSYVTGR